MRQWIRHPERTSSSIRRAEIWAEEDAGQGSKVSQRYRCLRRLLPRRTQIDRGMLEECALYARGDEGVVVYTSLRTSQQEHEKMDPDMLRRGYTAEDQPTRAAMPYYHPCVQRVGFRYVATARDAGVISVDYVLFPGDSVPVASASRLGRTALALLRLVHQHGYGHATSYVKRTLHDVIVPRDEYQDLYVQLRTRHAGRLIETWREVTDPKKHVFEDLGIAAWLMLLWRDMFTHASDLVKRVGDALQQPSQRYGDVWAQPPGGFVDVGCGNGLLVHILHCEVRVRKLTAGVSRLWAGWPRPQVMDGLS